MRILKSIFISSYMMLAAAAAALAAWKLFEGENALAWTGALLTVAPILSVFGRLMLLKRDARTSARLPLVNFLAGIGVVVSVASVALAGPGWTPAAVAVAGWAGLALYTFWYSRLDRTARARLVVGAKLPDFGVTDLKLANVGSTALAAGPAIILFYRGNWCPVCMAQIKELAARAAEFAQLGVRIALISPQPYAHTVALARKHSATPALEFYTDKGNAAARALGIDDPHGLPLGMQMLGYSSETVLPTLIVTDRDGTVVWTDETDNYRVRPEPDTFMNVLRDNRLVAQAA